MQHLTFILLFVFVKAAQFLLELLCDSVKTAHANRRDYGSGNQIRRPRRRRRRAQLNFSLHKVARKLQGTAEIHRDRSVVLFERNGNKYRADIITKHATHTVRLSSKWPHLGLRLRVFPVRVHGLSRRPYPGTEDFVIGQRDFDRDFVIQGTSAEASRRILSEVVCDRISEHKRLAHGRISLKIMGGQVEFGGVANRILDTEQVLAIVGNFVEIHRLMLMTLEGNLKAEMTFIEIESSTCMVCGVAIRDSFVSCKSCGTRHHRDCWDYVGKCSTYGCRSRRSQ